MNPLEKSPAGDEPRDDQLTRWIPLVVPLLALLIVIDTYFIAWAMVAIF
jgi:hypothetical protein